MIVFSGVSKTFGDTSGLDNVTLKIEPGEFLCVTGESGAGKSMLFSLLVGAETATAGTIMMDDVDLQSIPAAALRLFRQKVGIVYQDRKLLSTATVSENIAFPMEVCGASSEAIKQRVYGLLKRLGLALKGNAMPEHLSSAEKTLTAILRAVAHKPLILLADEPMTHLNPEQMRDVLGFFRELHAAGMTIVLATESSALAEALHVRTVRLEKGKIVSDSAAKASDVREVAEAVKNAIVKDQTSSVRDGLRPAGKKEEMPALEPVPMRKKVRVTAIHSD